MLAARGTVHGSAAVAFCTDATVMGGAMGVDGCRHIVDAIDTALRERVPVVGIWHSGGARLAEGVDPAWRPQIVHAHDWHTGVIPCLLNTSYRHDRYVGESASLLTLHNMQHQGNFYPGLMEVLGIGWNFLYIGGTTLFTQAYRPEEKTRAQGLLDTGVYATMTVTSFSSGALVTTGGWQWMNWASLVPIALCGLALVYLGAVQRRSC